MSQQKRLSVRFGACSHRGKVREHNEDSFVLAPPYFVVADGMGGHARGELASRAAVECFTSQEERWTTAEELRRVVEAATARVQRLGDGLGRPPGTTLAGTALTLQGSVPCWLVFNIGDSRIYLMRDGSLTQVSVDHSLARPGHLVRDRHIITRALGAGLKSPAVVDEWLIPIRAGDQILVCSDGLHSEVTVLLIAALLLSHEEPQSKAAALVEAANKAGGRDNVTAVVIAVDVVDSVVDLVSMDSDTLSSGYMVEEER